MVFMYQGQSLSGGSSSDEKVKQIPTSTGNTAYEVLFSGGANNTEETDHARKTNALRYLPSNEGLYTGYTSNQDVGVEIIGSNGELRARQSSSDYTIINSLNDINIKLYSNSKVLTIKEDDIVIGGTDNSWDGTNASLKNAIRSKMSPSESATLRIGQRATPTSNNRLSKIIFKMPVTDDNIEKPIMLEISAYNSTSTTSLNEGYDVIEIVFGYDSTNSTTYVKKFECAHSYYYLYKNQTVTEEGVDYDIWYLIYEFVTGIDTFELHRIYGPGYEYVKFYTTWLSDLPPTAIPATSLRYVAKSGDTMTGTLIGKANSTIGTWKLGRDNASFKKTDVSNVSAFYPVLSVKGYTYDWSIGTLGDDSNSKLYFVRTFDSDYYATGNKTQKFGLYGGSSGKDSEYVIAHSGNVGTGDSDGQIKIAGTNVNVKNVLKLSGGTMTGDILRKYSDISITALPSANKYHTAFSERDTNNNQIGFIGCYQYTNGTIGQRIYCTRKVGSNTIYNGIQLNISGTGARSVFVDDNGIWRSALGLNLGWWDGVPKIGNDGLIEIGKYIDFHTASSSTSDYDFRFTNNARGKLTASGTITQGSSRKIKENIKPLSDKEALKILELEPVSFDYVEEYGGDKDHRGFIAEDVAEILPNLTSEEQGDEKDLKHFIPMSLSYNEIIPYLVKVIQIQQKQIDELTERVSQLEASGFKFEV